MRLSAPRIALSIAATLIVASCSDSTVVTEAATSSVPTSETLITSTAATTISTEPSSSGTSAQGPPNVLLLILDDLGVDSAECYDGDVAAMPNLAALCEEGLVFDTVWSNPACSPTRATMLTGRFGFRTGVGQALGPNDVGLKSDEFTLPMALAAAGIPSANIGKWHLAGTDSGSPDTHPNDAGYEHYAGSPTGVLPDYEEWRRVVDGVAATETGYATTVTVDDALAWIEGQEGSWFAWVGFNAPHEPFHLPPTDLHTRDDLTGTPDHIARNQRAYFEAMLEALDTEIGRLLESIEPDVLQNTVIMVVGDNGTAGQVAAGVARSHTKGTIYQGGIHVPLIVVGPGVAAGRTDALVNLVDVFPTVLDLLDVTTDAVVDGESFASVLGGGAGTRSTLYSELFGRTDRGRPGVTVSDGQWKLIQFEDGTEELYDLKTDPGELDNLVGSTETAPAAALIDLRERLETIAAT